eukprot:273029_1
MGQTCCSTDNSNNTRQTADTIARHSERPPKNVINSTLNSQSLSADSSLDSEFNMDSNNHLKNPTQYSMEPTPEIQHTTTEKEKAKIAFKDAVQNGNDSLVMHFVQEYPELDLLQFKFENGNNPLQVAVKNKSHNLMIYLLENGVSPNEQNHKNGDTALHTAVRTRDVKIVALLSKYLADAAITNKAYETPLTVASDNSDADIIELLAPDTLREIRKRISSMGFKHQTSAAMHSMADDILSDNDEEINSRRQLYSIKEKPMYEIQQMPADYKTFDDKLNASEKMKMDVMRVVRQNPFNKLKNDNTKKALMEMEQIANAKGDLPILSGWLEKKQSSMPYQWQRRWVVVKGSHFLWSDIQRDINDAKNIKERKKFNNSISLMSVTEIKSVTKGKTQRKFTLNVGASKKRKEYLWKCATKTDREYWVKGLKKHIAHTKAVVNYFGTK